MKARTSFWRGGGVAVLLLSIACTGLSDCRQKGLSVEAAERIGTRDALAPVSRGEDGFLYARVTKRQGQVPARFAARLPQSVAEFDGDWSSFPPRGQVSAAICAGDPEMVERWVSAVAGAADKGPIGDDLEARFVAQANYCDNEFFCRQVLLKLEEASDPVRKVLLKSLAHCRSPEVLEAIESSSSDEAVVDWYFNGYGRRFGRLTERFRQAAQSTVGRRTGRGLRNLGVTLGRFDDPTVVEFVGSLGEGLEAESRAWLGVGMRESSVPGAKDVYSKACRHPVVGEDPMCDSEIAALLGGSPPERQRTFDDEIREVGFRPTHWLKTHPGRRGELIAAFQRCILAEDAHEWERATCTQGLASLDRAEATAIVAQLPTDSKLPSELRVLKATLAQFPTNAALDASLVEWGLVDDELSIQATHDGAAEPITACDRLVAAGRVHVFDVETGVFPNEHDVVMTELAGYAGALMTGVVFEEVPPRIVQTKETWETVGPYLLRAYARGQIIETEAADHGDWYDLDAVLGLLNVTLRELGSDFRYIVTDTDGQLATVLGAPKSGIGRAHQRGVLNIEDASEAMQLGKDFERQVFERLDEGEPLWPEFDVRAE